MNRKTRRKMKEGFDYEEWYREQALELAGHLIRALHVAVNINEADSLWDTIEAKIKSLNLPKQKCCRCGAEMEYWDWALRQGYCDKCIDELMKEVDR